ncbi:MAG: TonB-dependent copper receptor [Candidatus Thiodiazotropha taylori]|nr:TonB-dependent copper receptor [Candidatus Thiodiazotropha taylori]MCG8027552.1 TonB-dependent copper receptor [Candidatus Thiodiazotropha taylori]MCG8042123.1 TonB-dependent copper receptor [Candidatus Thiodiazotropha taylori]MCG8107370.1 TonB-dependent copper receptor [Candidatus Thiodiazotropha taylori]MCG8109303.1 TonB-dependent copper receptor [Candidatus Thiodiazotropha taylori]
MRLTALSLAISSILTAQAVVADEHTENLQDVVVEAEGGTSPAVTTTPMDGASSGIPGDAADFLRDINGVSGIRMGGQGIDPIIRGQSQNRLNIIMDGAYIHGGCPNRMDPPTAYSAMESYDSVTVIKGSQTVIYGGGGSGGTVLFERNAPQFEEGKPYLGSAEVGYKSNSQTKEASVDVAAGTELGFARGVIGYKDADNYEDGDGNEVRSAFTKQSGNLILGYTPDTNKILQLNLEATREDDALYAGAGMDSPMSDADNIRLKYEQNDAVGPFSAIKAEIYSSEVDHLMDNYSLREQTAPMRMSVPTTSDTKGGRLLADLMLGETTLTVGFDIQNNERDADRFSGMANMEPTTLQSIMWPGAELEQTGIFMEVSQPIGSLDRLKAGLRYDRVDASISRGDEKPDLGPSPTPNNLYAAYYADTSDETTENNVGGFVQYEREIGDGTFYTGLSRSVRTADATERYLASFSRNMMTMMDMSWVGNPELEPEKHHQLEAGLRWQGGAWDTDVSVFYNDVSDYILRDKARGQDGILVANGTANIYRNVDAEFYGIEWEGGYQIMDSLTTTASLAYVRAENTTDDRNIAQISPLEATIGMEYSMGALEFGGNVRMNAKQTRADLENGSGQDVQETPGWGVIDLYGSYEIAKAAEVSFGIDNLLDKSYAYHVNRANADPFNPEAIQVNEPGREVWVKAGVRF